MEIPEVLQEAHHYLLGAKFRQIETNDLTGNFQARYQLGTMKEDSPDGIAIDLFHYDDQTWTITFLGLSGGRFEQVKEIREALSKLPGYRPASV